MANTFVKIATVDVGAGGSTSISFTSIPQTYTDLIIQTSLRISSAPAAYGMARAKVQMNSITTGYSNRLLYGLNSNVYSDVGTDYFTFFYTAASDATANTFSSSSLYFPNYSSSTAKAFSSDSASESNGTNLGILALNAGLQTSTAAISSLTITQSDGGTFVQYSSATLYGISKS